MIGGNLHPCLHAQLDLECDTFRKERCSDDVSICKLTYNKLCGKPPQYAPAPCKLTDLLTLKVVSESRVTWVTCVPILVFLGLSVLDLGPMYSTDRQTSDRRQMRIIA